MINELKNPLSWTSQFSFCGMPLRLDTYSGCPYKCKYCFSHSRNGNYNISTVKVANPYKIIHKFKNAICNSNSSTGLLAQCIRHKMPIHLGGMSDPFQPLESKMECTFEVLKYLSSIDYPCVISTKSVHIAKKKYLRLLSKYSNIIVQVSFSTLKQNNAKELEPKCPTPRQRLNLIRRLNMEGIKTTIRWQPYIPGLSESPSIFVDKVADTGIDHIILEFLKIPIDRPRLFKQAHFLKDVIAKHMDRGFRRIGREWVVTPLKKAPVIDGLKIALKNTNITLGVADNDIQYLSDTQCCCGLDKYLNFAQWNKYQINFAISQGYKSGKIVFKTIESEWKPTGSVDKFINSKSRLNRNVNPNTTLTYIQDRWENLQSQFNPIHSFRVKYSGCRDKDGYRVYEFERGD